MVIGLNELELRVLGALIEKSLSQPGAYPMTLNAILLGANQKQNREPVLHLAEADVGTALHTLGLKQLAQQVPPAPGARANRFAHNVVEGFHWDRRDQAVMAELMLRGRQTAGELRTRASRMTPIPDLEAIGAILQGLMTNEPPFVEELPREPGRSTNRWRHLLTAEMGERAVEGETTVSPSAAGGDASAGAGTDVSLAHRVAVLEEQVARIMTALDELRKSPESPVDRPDTSAVQ